MFSPSKFTDILIRFDTIPAFHFIGYELKLPKKLRNYYIRDSFEGRWKIHWGLSCSSLDHLDFNDVI